MRTPPPEVTPPRAGRKRKGFRCSCCRRRHPRPEWRKWRCRRRPRRTRSNLVAPAAAPWTWSGAASPTAWCGRPSRCLREFPLVSAWGRGEPGPAGRPWGAPGPPSGPDPQQPLPLGSALRSCPAHCQFLLMMGHAPSAHCTGLVREKDSCRPATKGL